jgi:hypothetical protein
MIHFKKKKERNLTKYGTPIPVKTQILLFDGNAGKEVRFLIIILNLLTTL